jgi:hypothetical protein
MSRRSGQRIKTHKAGQWIYHYLSVIREEIDKGFYKTQRGARMAANQHKSWGAIVTPPIRVEKGYKLQDG